MYLHRLCTKLKRIYLVLGHIVYVCDIVRRTCRSLCGIRHFLHIVLSTLSRLLWHVKFPTEHAGQQLGRWLVAAYKLPHWDHEDRMALHIVDLYCLVCPKWRRVCDIRCFLHTVACRLFGVLWRVNFQTKHACQHAWFAPGSDIPATGLELCGQTNSSHLPLVFMQ